MEHNSECRKLCGGCYWEGNCDGATEGCEHYDPLNNEEYETAAYEREVRGCVDDYYALAEEEYG